MLADYDSASLDLHAPQTYRDLTKPMGAQLPSRASEIRSQFAELKEFGPDGVPPFHYGSHYSSEAIVLFYLIRMEPFTSAAIRLQSGVFDHADRLFHSIPTTFKHARTNSADVKEAVPELYYLPEMLVNANGLGLGSAPPTACVRVMSCETGTGPAWRDIAPHLSPCALLV